MKKHPKALVTVALIAVLGSITPAAYAADNAGGPLTFPVPVDCDGVTNGPNSTVCMPKRPVDPLIFARGLDLEVTEVGAPTGFLIARATVTGPRVPVSATGETITFVIDGVSHTAVIGSDQSAEVTFVPKPGGGDVHADLPHRVVSTDVSLVDAHATTTYEAPETPPAATQPWWKRLISWFVSLFTGSSIN